jgi:hypothetical protein
MNSVARLWRLASSDDAQEEQRGRAPTLAPREEDDFPYTVEIRNYTGACAEQTLAVTVSRRIGFATYYAALELYSDRSITLRHKGLVVARWNARKH